MKVYVAPCGIGLGHVIRCEPIARELTKQGHEVVFSTYLDGLEYARSNGFRLMKSYAIGFRVKEDGTVDFKLTAATSGFSLGVRRFLRQMTQEIRNLQRFRPDIVLSDSRVSSLLAAKLMGIPSILLLNQYRVDIVRRPSAQRIGILDRIFFFVANLSWIFLRTLLGGVWARSDRILIPDFPPPHTISASNLTIPSRYRSKVELIGPIVPEGPERLPSGLHLKRQLGFEATKPLVYAAISGPKVERTFLADILERECAKIADRYNIVLSRGDPEGVRVPVKKGSLTVFGWIDHQISYLKACDILISRAGHGTITKAIAFGKPVILIPIPDHTEQYGNARQVQALGFGRMIEQSELSAAKLQAAIDALMAGAGESANRALQLNGKMEGIQGALDAISSVLVAQRN